MLADAHISSLGYLWFYVICRRHYLVPYRLQTQNPPVAYEEVLKLILSGEIYHKNLCFFFCFFFFWGGGGNVCRHSTKLDHYLQNSIDEKTRFTTSLQ